MGPVRWIEVCSWGDQGCDGGEVEIWGTLTEGGGKGPKQLGRTGGEGQGLELQRLRSRAAWPGGG